MSTNASRRTRDAALEQSIAMPAAAEATVATPAIDLGVGTDHPGRTRAHDSLHLVVPALTATMLPDDTTATYTVEVSEDGETYAPLYGTDLVVQTGADGAGAAAQIVSVALPRPCPRYVRGAATLGALTTDASAVDLAIRLVF